MKEINRARAVWFALATFFIWGFEAPMAYYFGKYLSHPIILLVISYSFSTLAIYVKESLSSDHLETSDSEMNFFETLGALPFREKLLLNFAGALRFSKDFVYYYVIYLYPDKIIHIIGLNYLWPVNLYLFEVLRNTMKSKSGHKGFNTTNITVFLVSLLGGYFIYSSSGMHFNEDPLFVILLTSSIIFGSGHSFIYGLYSNGVAKNLNFKPSSTFSLKYRSLVAFIFSLVGCIFLKVEASDVSLFYIIGFGILFSIVQVLLAHGFYTKSIKIGDQDDFSAFTIYSMFFAIITSVVILGIPIENEGILGYLIVGYSVFFIRNKKSYLNALDKSLISLLIFLFAYFHFHDKVKDIDFAANLDVVSGMFSIIIGFSLSRLLEKTKKENELLTLTGMQMSKLLNYLQMNCGDALYQEVRLTSNDIFRKVTRFNFFPDSWSVVRGQEIIEEVDKLEKQLFSKIKEHEQVEDNVVIEYLNEFETHVELWINERSIRLPRGERYASYILGIMTILGFAYSLAIEKNLSAQTTDLSILGFSFAVLYLLYSMTDLDKNRPDSSLMQVFYSQRLLLKQGFRNYLPSELIERGNVDIYANKLEVESDSKEGGITTLELSASPDNSRRLKAITPYVILVVAVLSVLFR